jgi:predicted DNA-binding helix-hairpin-helix protein
MWAILHPERFPVDINRAPREELLRVPGLGLTSVNRILQSRVHGARVRTLRDIGRESKRLQKAATYLKF